MRLIVLTKTTNLTDKSLAFWKKRSHFWHTENIQRFSSQIVQFYPIHLLKQNVKTYKNSNDHQLTRKPNINRPNGHGINARRIFDEPT